MLIFVNALNKSPLLLLLLLLLLLNPNVLPEIMAKNLTLSEKDFCGLIKIRVALAKSAPDIVADSKAVSQPLLPPVPPSTGG